MAKRYYWAGFSNDRLCGTLEHYGDHDVVLAIYLYKKDAKKHYQDVRKIEIREIKGPKKQKCLNS